ncbi:MAG: hypothetical protein HC904_08975 [Blastochloris sp.]|nr:hypothetical protein [Blastochloris sp.]
MTGEEATVRVIGALHEARIAFMMVGSLSRNYYAFARSTKDADIVMEADGDLVRSFFEHLPQGISLDPQVTFETVTGTTRQILTVEGSAFKIELFYLSDDPHDCERFQRRVAVKILDRECFIPTAEDVIVQKLRWARGGRRGKDYDDARDVMAVQGHRLDFTYIRAWADRHGTLELMEEIHQSVAALF